MDANIRQMRVVSLGFRILALAFLIAAIVKAIFIGLFSLNPTFVNSLPSEIATEIILDLGLVQADSSRMVTGFASREQVLSFVLATIVSGLIIAFGLFSIGVVVDFIREVGTEISDSRRVQVEPGRRR